MPASDRSSWRKKKGGMGGSWPKKEVVLSSMNVVEGLIDRAFWGWKLGPRGAAEEKVDG